MGHWLFNNGSVGCAMRMPARSTTGPVLHADIQMAPGRRRFQFVDVSLRIGCRHPLTNGRDNQTMQAQLRVARPVSDISRSERTYCAAVQPLLGRVRPNVCGLRWISSRYPECGVDFVSTRAAHLFRVKSSARPISNGLIALPNSLRGICATTNSLSGTL